MVFINVHSKNWFEQGCNKSEFCLFVFSLQLAQQRQLAKVNLLLSYESFAPFGSRC
jgi:hypothetical protein